MSGSDSDGSANPGPPGNDRPDDVEETDERDRDEKSGEVPAPNAVHRRKRGAIPTPKSEIDAAAPYVPETEDGAEPR